MDRRIPGCHSFWCWFCWLRLLLANGVIARRQRSIPEISHRCLGNSSDRHRGRDKRKRAGKNIREGTWGATRPNKIKGCNRTNNCYNNVPTWAFLLFGSNPYKRLTPEPMSTYYAAQRLPTRQLSLGSRDKKNNFVAPLCGNMIVLCGAERSLNSVQWG